MPFKMLLLPPYGDRPPPEPFISDDWPEKIKAIVPGAVVKIFEDWRDAREDIVDADAAYGMVTPELLPLAKTLKWIMAPGAGLGPEYYYDALNESDIVVTNPRAIQGDHLAAHAMAFLLAFARRFDHYFPRKAERSWKHDARMIHLAETTILIVGVGGAGTELAKICKVFGMRVLGADPRVTEAPEHVDELFTPDKLEARLGEADFVALTVPETPATQGFFNAAKFAAMKPGGYFINIGRGRTVVTADLLAALQSGHLAGAGLDVMDPEPLPPDHPFWDMNNVLMTPHIAVLGAPNQQRREEVLLENVRRFTAGEPLLNVVDKKNWF
jgi:phosphoglycerate dehydrogenase-like enzyme